MFLETLDKTILNIWPQLTIFIVVLVVVRLAAIKNGGKKTTFHFEFLNLLLIISYKNKLQSNKILFKNLYKYKYYKYN